MTDAVILCTDCGWSGADTVWRAECRGFPCELKKRSDELLALTAPSEKDAELIARLRRTVKRKAGMATNRTAPVIEYEYDELVNPDGPEAADRLATLTEAMDASKVQLETRRHAGRFVPIDDVAAVLVGIAAMQSPSSPPKEAK